jgi:hypothetical protein
VFVSDPQRSFVPEVAYLVNERDHDAVYEDLSAEGLCRAGEDSHQPAGVEIEDRGNTRIDILFCGAIARTDGENGSSFNLWAADSTRQLPQIRRRQVCRVADAQPGIDQSFE